MRMKLSDFNYDLPKELVAEYPNKNRDEARLMVIDRKDYSIKHRQFKDMIEYFDENDVIILNNTKVFPARLYGNKEKTGARIEVGTAIWIEVCLVVLPLSYSTYHIEQWAVYA